jgi:adenine-specific DNA-methyltransferase
MPTLTFAGKDKLVNHHHKVPFRVLNKQYAFEATLGTLANSIDNRIIHGDNLEALKSLLPEFEGKVKCIYIDPPYNTGNDIDKNTGWKYNDAVDDPKIRAWLGEIVGKDDLTKHDKWLCMMYPRLKLLHKLLDKTGVILASIDDHEMHNLRQIMDEIFGENNFIAQIIWDKTRKNDARLFSSGHEYILVYARSLSTLREKKTIWREEKPGAKEIIEEWRRLVKIHNDDHAAIEAQLTAWYKTLSASHPSKKLSRYRHVDKNGPWRDRDISWPGGGGPRYDVIHDQTGLPCAVPEQGWRYANLEQMQAQIRRGLVVFRQDHREPPIRKAHLLPLPEELEEENQDDGDDSLSENVFGLQVMPTYIYRQAQPSVKMLRQIFDGQKVFPNPKDHEVLRRLIRYVAPPDALILDSFGGSGSTAHAVLEANRLDNGNRRFILIEMMDYAETITAERVRRVMNGYGSGGKAVDGLGGGFDYYTIGAPLFTADDLLNEDVGIETIRGYVAYTEGIRPEDQASQDNPVSHYLLGRNADTAWFFYYEPDWPTALDMDFLSSIQIGDKPGTTIIYADRCLLSSDFMSRNGLIFKKIPRDISRF